MLKRLIVIMAWAVWKFFINPEMPLPKDPLGFGCGSFRTFFWIYGSVCLLLALYAGPKTDMPWYEQVFISVLGLIALRNVWRDWMFARRRRMG